MKKKVIYDFGMHDGQNIEYFSNFSDLVIGIDANPELIKIAKNKFKKEIKSKKVQFINGLISGKKKNYDYFYVNKKNDFLSSVFSSSSNYENFKKIKLKTINPSKLIKKYSKDKPLYIKIDLEGIDYIVLENLFKNKIRPEYLSVECHNFNVLLSLMKFKYKSYNISPGIKMKKFYNNFKIKNKVFNFTNETSGPFGKHITTPWVTEDYLFQSLLTNRFLNWFDIHATDSIVPQKKIIDFKNEIGIKEFFLSLKSSINHRIKGA